MDDSGFPRTPDRSVKLLGTYVRYLRSVETLIGARGPDFLGGSATRRVAGGSTRSYPQTPEHHRELSNPACVEFIQPVEDLGLEAL